MKGLTMALRTHTEGKEKRGERTQTWAGPEQGEKPTRKTGRSRSSGGGTHTHTHQDSVMWQEKACASDDFISENVILSYKSHLTYYI